MPRDIDISLEDDILHIRGERKFAGEVKEENYHRIERAYGHFERNIPLRAGWTGTGSPRPSTGACQDRAAQGRGGETQADPIVVEEEKKE